MLRKWGGGINCARRKICNVANIPQIASSISFLFFFFFNRPVAAKIARASGRKLFLGTRGERDSVNFQHTNARAGLAILIDAGAEEKEEKLFAQLVYWQIQFPDQR